MMYSPVGKGGRHLSKIETNSPTPLYQQVKEIIANRIQKKYWVPGDLIPTEQQLIEEFNVSRTTIRQAVSALVQEGLLEKKQGKGTIVKSQRLTGTLGRLTGFAEEVMEKGLRPHSKLLRAEFRKDLFFEKGKLKVADDEEILMIERVRFADEEPIAIEKSFWPKEIGNILMKYDLNGAIYYQILEEHGVYLVKANEKIRAVNATIPEADYLGTASGAALLEMTRHSFGVNDQPIEYTCTKYRSDRYHYDIDLHR